MTRTRTEPTSVAELGEFASALEYGDLPSEVVTHIKECALDSMGCGLFGMTLPWTTILIRSLEDVGPGGQVMPWGGRAPLLSVPHAAMVHGTAIHAFELDDLHPSSIVHPGSVVISAALAAAALRPEISGSELLAAIVSGYEVAARVGMSVGAAHLIAGWHPTGTHGALGAAAAAGRVLQLDPAQMGNALGTAGSMSAGLMSAQYESMVKRLHAGHAAQSGVYAALLARRGFVGIRDLFEAEYGGYGRTFSPAFQPAALTEGLGSTWETLKVGFKPYSANGSCHPTIDCLRELKREHALDLTDVARVEIEVSTATKHHVGWPYRPESETTAQMNLPYIVAVVLADGDAFVDQFTAERIAAPELVEVASRVHVHAARDIDDLGDRGRHMTRLRLELTDGGTVVAQKAFAHGSSREPMTYAEVRAKFARLAGRLFAPQQVAALEREVVQLDEASSLDGLREALHPADAPERP